MIIKFPSEGFMTDYQDTSLFIAGQWRPASDGRRLPVVNPATEEVIGHVAYASRGDLDDAVAASADGFAIWKDTSAIDRSKVMRRAAELLRERMERIANLLTTEQGKPLAEARGEVLFAADTIDWFAEEARRIYGRVIPSRNSRVTQLAIKQPVGPVAAFTPWNFPINQVVRKVSAALATGCSIIVKAPEETPASPAELVRCFIDAGLPACVIGLIFGDPAEISSTLIAHPVIVKISFTGSTAVGKHLAAMAGQHMKRSTMELGGHAPVIIMDDADLDSAVDLMTAFKYRNAGQVCIAPTRFLVQRGIADPFIEKFAAASKNLKVGPGAGQDSDMGPLANERRIPAIERMVQDALSRGGRLVAGGQRIGNKGYFFEPTVLSDVPADAQIMNEEPFGPVAVINRIDDIDEALTEANRLRYGLASYAFTKSAAHQDTLRNRMRAGMLAINHVAISLPEAPFGGMGDSGYGSEGGSEAVESYLDTRFVTQMN